MQTIKLAPATGWLDGKALRQVLGRVVEFANDALDRISKLLKQDRDANFIAKTPDGLTVNRWLTTGMLAASASSNEAGYITHKVARSFGLLGFDNQARV